MRTLPAAEIERVVVDEIRWLGSDRALIKQVLADAHATIAEECEALVTERTDLKRTLDRCHCELQTLAAGGLADTDVSQRIGELDAYDGLVDMGYRKHLRMDHGKDEFSIRSVRGNHTNRIEGFWGYAKTRLSRFRGMTPDTFLCHLKECEFRFNHRRQDLYQVLLNLCRKYPLSSLCSSLLEEFCQDGPRHSQPKVGPWSRGKAALRRSLTEASIPKGIPGISGWGVGVDFLDIDPAHWESRAEVREVLTAKNASRAGERVGHCGGWAGDGRGAAGGQA